MTTERTASTVAGHGVELDDCQGVGFVPLVCRRGHHAAKEPRERVVE